MIQIGNYSIEEYPAQNKIVITVPTIAEATFTTPEVSVVQRKVSLSDTDLMAILAVVKSIYETLC